MSSNKVWIKAYVWQCLGSLVNLKSNKSSKMAHEFLNLFFKEFLLCWDLSLFFLLGAVSLSVKVWSLPGQQPGLTTPRPAPKGAQSCPLAHGASRPSFRGRLMLWLWSWPSIAGTARGTEWGWEVLIPHMYIAPCLLLSSEDFKIRVPSITSLGQGWQSDQGQRRVLMRVVNMPVTLVLPGLPWALLMTLMWMEKVDKYFCRLTNFLRSLEDKVCSVSSYDADADSWPE